MKLVMFDHDGERHLGAEMFILGGEDAREIGRVIRRSGDVDPRLRRRLPQPVSRA